MFEILSGSGAAKSIPERVGAIVVDSEGCRVINPSRQRSTSKIKASELLLCSKYVAYRARSEFKRRVE